MAKLFVNKRLMKQTFKENKAKKQDTFYLVKKTTSFSI